ncbi:MAG: DinB family protein [Planctomycetota bacterium]|nr:DinB family protein [Planctomycetota bacterium]MEC8560689.1 DinB family protein [Planctomycetota bacterium]MEC8734590.1 DinB family protein [Planctomycetota bacterium]MEC8818314.1 DinB family protein [Planctomycetota bacterium]MEC9156605.1 DinB family protein [Planctomycetota bacterium]
MYDKERIIHQLERTRVLTLQMIERVPHDRWFEMPTGVTHVAWNIGHIATAEYFLGMAFVRGAREDDAGMIDGSYAGLFGYGSVPQADPGGYPSPDELMRTLEAVHRQLLLETRAMPPEALVEPCRFDDAWFDHHPFFKEVGEALECVAFHEHIHIGTLGLLRRELGSGPIDYFQESSEGRRFV